MRTPNLSLSVQSAIAAVENHRVQEIAKELSVYGLGICVPHIHENDSVLPLPTDKIQYENDLTVTFLGRDEFEATRNTAFPVQWSYIEKEKRMVPRAWCHNTIPQMSV